MEKISEFVRLVRTYGGAAAFSCLSPLPKVTRNETDLRNVFPVFFNPSYVLVMVMAMGSAYIALNAAPNWWVPLITGSSQPSRQLSSRSKLQWH